MIQNKKIINCELAYTKCFSEFFEDENIVRFNDDLIPDMYYHNYTFIKNVINNNELYDCIKNELALRLSENKNFCNILLNTDISDSLRSMFISKLAVSTNGYYSFNFTELSKMNSIEGCEIVKVNCEKMVEDILYLDMEHDGENLGKDFCTRRAYRRSKVYLSDEGVNSYVCYHNGVVIGNCDLFIHESIAKIEDFAVLPTYQRKGYGTSILKALIENAIQENVHTIYLVTDEEDTAKKMYVKLGFTKIGEKADLFFNL